MRGPLAVRVNDGSTDRHVTRHIDDLELAWSAPGGHKSLQAKINVPLDYFADLGPADTITVYDTRTGAVLWDGYTEVPGQRAGTVGQGYDIAALGGMSLLDDRSEKIVYVDRDLARLSPMVGNHGSARVDTADDQLVLGFSSGAPVAAGSTAGVRYVGLDGSGQRVGGYGFDWAGAKTDTRYQVRAETAVGAGGTGEWTLDRNANLTVAGGQIRRTAAQHGTDKTAVRLALRRTGGATNITDDLSAVTVTGFYVLGLLADQYGVLQTTNPPPVTAATIISDLIGRMLPGKIDPDRTSITPTGYAPDQLAFHDGATARAVLDHLDLLEPDMVWELLERAGDGTRGHRTAYRPWPTTARYELSVDDDYDAPGGEDDLCNRVLVTWTDAAGVDRSKSYTQTVADLDRRGIVRDADPIALPEGLGSVTVADQIGPQVLAARARPSRAGSATVARVIWDRLAGRPVAPWELRPGYCARVRELDQVLRITEATYNDASCSTQLTLGEPLLTIEQRLARLDRNRRRTP